MPPDVPKQYKRFTDAMSNALANAGDAIWCVVSELGCDRYECEGKCVKITITAADVNEAQPQADNSASLTCQAVDCTNKASIHLCDDCFDKVNSVVRLPRQA